jgi:hypothetical protein
MSMPEIREVRLEIVRPGPPHNQLLSRLTPYMALCGEGSPITFNIHLDHSELLNSLEHLRYVTLQGAAGAPIPARLREAEVIKLGREVARILADIPTLSTELARAQCDGPEDSEGTLVHLRLVASGSELALIPFEIAIAPLAYPGEGLEFCLQASLPIVLTREIRRGRPKRLKWDRSSQTEPRILVAFAEPAGMAVPGKQHVDAIRAALEPWIRRLPPDVSANTTAETATARLPNVKKRLRVLANASIEGIYRMCASERFTHVHILAHGGIYIEAGIEHFGVALCRDGSNGVKEVVSGKRLAKALRAENSAGGNRSDPLVVTLATCDSGNQASVLVPVGSIAHALHSEGIPWVFASQFPLTIDGSVRMTDDLYRRLFRGDDPRHILFELRRQLYRSAASDHDWASIVAYATTPPGFDRETEAFHHKQVHEAIQVGLEHADAIVLGTDWAPERKQQEAQSSIDRVKSFLELWMDRLPRGDSADDKRRRAEANGIGGATYKRLGVIYDAVSEADEAKRCYRDSFERYSEAIKNLGATDDRYSWYVTQYLSMSAILREPPDRRRLERAKAVAERDIAEASDDSARAWAYGNLAELELLTSYHSPRGGPKQSKRAARARELCEHIIALTTPNSFHVKSTLQQFERYTRFWSAYDARWREVAQAAIESLRGTPDPAQPKSRARSYDYPSPTSSSEET